MPIVLTHVYCTVTYPITMIFLEALVHDWVDYLHVKRGASAHTVSNYHRDVACYALNMKGQDKVSVEDTSSRDIEDYTIRLTSGQVAGTSTAASSVACALTTIRGLHKYVLTEGAVGVDTAAQLRVSHQGRYLPKALSADEVGRLLDAVRADDSPIGLHDATLLGPLCVTGVCVSETVSLNADDFDLNGDVPVVRLFGKGRKGRVVPVGSFAVDALCAYWVRARPALAIRGRESTTFFPNSRGGALSRQSA